MIKKLLLSFVGALVVMGLASPLAHADVNDFVITKFDADYTLSRADPQGELKVTEKIAVDFSDNNHGILRAIPDTYKKHQLQLRVNDISSASGAPTQYTTYSSNGNTVLKIGDPNRTVTGTQQYTINYTLRNVVSFYGDHDELYWDINGDQWAQQAQAVTAVVHLPAGLTLGSQQPICYTGKFSSTEQECTIRAQGNVITAQAIRPLAGYETMSIVAGFGKGYFRPAAWYETAGEYAGTAAKFLVPFLLIAGTAGAYWYRYGRDPKGRGVIVPEYEPPDVLKAIEAGTIIDFKTDNRDITATIIDLAIRGYIKIIETVNQRKLLPDTKTYSLRLEKTDFSGLDESETTLLNGIFSNHAQGEEIDLGTLKYKLSSTAAALQKSVKASLVARGYFRKTPLSTTLRFAALLFLEFLAVIVLAVILQAAAVMLGIAAGVVLAVIFILLLPSRTSQGVAAKESILGLKKYLQVAESERIKKLQSPDAPYAAKSDQPKKTVELFEKLLPFAMVLGVEQQWAKQFEHIYRTPPDWYQGNWATFNAVYLASALNSGVQSSVNTVFSSPSSSSSSGFSGGFSGGGGGGGGGGGW